MSGRTAEDVLDDLAALLRHFNDREYSGELGPQTLLFADLGMASIDAVVLAETIEQYYGRKFPFHEFLAEVGARGEVRDLELGELARFLHRHLDNGG
jgi:acyl carrier protein